MSLDSHCTKEICCAFLEPTSTMETTPPPGAEPFVKGKRFSVGLKACTPPEKAFWAKECLHL
jgi:hypothetical protein